MSISVRPISSKSDLRKFIRFANEMYADNPYYCPPLMMDEMNTFNPKKNPALEVSEFQNFLAYEDGRIVGRVCALINHRANEAWKVKNVRFGWLDFVDDKRVSQALLDAVAAWGRERGMTAMNGPVGFTDFDREGLLLEGYDYNAPMAASYNYPYYVDHMDAYGLRKEVDWIEYQIYPPKEIPERLQRIGKIVMERNHLHIYKPKNFRELVRRYGTTYMDVFDQAYQALYNYQPLTARQKEYYAKMYFPLLNLEFCTIVVNDKDEIVSVGVGMPDISDALRRCKGRLFPTGWYHILKALKAKKMDAFDLLLIAVRPDYQNMGVNSLIFVDQIPVFNRYQIKRVDTTNILESNTKNQANFEYYEKKQHKRRRAYIREI
ncbi:MAG: N-acetyltransferase [Paludibacteraceae bacterium]|nr:N-acetyltransferase [Paludibacteraceae bacterium]